MADISKIKLPNNTTYTIRDSNARTLDNNDFDTINVTELNAGDLIVTGGARFLNTINGDISGNSATATSATSATKATQDESGNNIKSTYANAISISDHTITLKNKNGASLGTVTVPDNATDNTKLPLTGGTMTGQIVLASNGYKTSSTGGYTVDQYGNFKHQSSDTSQYWNIQNNAGTNKFSVYWETGNVTAAGTVTASKFIGVSEADLKWGGANITGSYGCIDAALMDELGANRFQFIKADAITVEYSRDNGETWTDYGATDAQKQQIFAQGGGLTIGKADSTHKATEHPGEYQLRITINTGVASIYSYLNKFVIYVSTNNSGNCSCKIQRALQSTPTTFEDHTDWISVTGWSGYNVLNTSLLIAGTGSGQYGRIRFIFKDATSTGTSYNGLTVLQIKAFGGVGWSCPSTMAKTGHIYSYNENMDATFPAIVTAATLKSTGDIYEAGSKLSDKYSAKTGNANYVRVKNSSTVGQSSSFTFNDLAKQHFAMGMIYSGTDSPTGTNGWHHGISMAWEDGVNTSWVSQIAVGVSAGTGIWYRTNSGTIIGRAWKRILDESNYDTYTVQKNGTGASGTWGISISGNAATATSATTASKLGSSNVGSATQPIYLNGGTATACTYTLGKSVPSDAVFTDTDTKNTAGSTDTSSKIFLIGATSQAANPQTYSQDTAYVGTDGCLYSGGTKVLTAHQDISGKADKATTLAGYGITDAKIASGVITLGSNTITPLTSSSTLNATKLSGTIPSSCYTDTNNAVTQTPTDIGNATYELLFSGTADNTTHTEGARKSKYATFNPDKQAFTFGTRLENSTIGGASYAQGDNITASGAYSYASGSRTIASGNYSHAEGYHTTASGSDSHAEGNETTASDDYSHAEGYGTTASGDASHAEGRNTTASGDYSHAEGSGTTASGNYSHAECGGATASGSYSHAEGIDTTANHRSQHVFGEYNIVDPSTKTATERGNYVEIVGNGIPLNSPSNARTLDWDGNEWLAGTLTTTDVINSTNWDGTNTSLKTAVTDKLSKSSGTTLNDPISGSIAVTANYFSKAASVDMSKSNNNLSSDYFGLVDFRDKNQKRFGYIQFGVRTAGGTDASLRAVNYASGGTTTEYTNTLTLVTSKAGAYTYSVSSAANFRTAIGAAAASSIKTKENISDLTEDEALKLLKIRPVSFDYKQGFDIDNKYERNYGVIAEETLDIIPSVVNIPTTEGYEFDETKGTDQELITVDYAKFVPYLIKLVQMQQQEIDELKNR